MPQSRAPLVLFRTGFFQIDPCEQIPDYEWKDRFTSDQSRLDEADAVIFHIPDLREKPVVTPRRPGQYWVAWCKEPTLKFPELTDPEFMRPYDFTMTYQRSSDFWAPYLPPLAAWRQARHASLPQRSATPVAMFQSSSINHSGRIGFAAELMRHIDVHSYGKILNNRALPGPDLRRATKHETIAAYPFGLAFENSIETDYVTEKIYDCLLAGTVPIYLGTTDVAEFVPEGSYIDANAHGGPKGLAAYLHHLLEHPDEYHSYLAWRDRPLPPKLVAMTESVSVDHFLRLLDRLPPRPDAPQRKVGVFATVAPAQCESAPCEFVTLKVDDAPLTTAEHLENRAPVSALDAPSPVRNLIDRASRLTPLRIKAAKTAMVAMTWLVGLLFLDASWAAPLFAATATFAWLAGARWIQHVGAAVLVVAILVRIGAIPPPSDWRSLNLTPRARPEIGK
jgi:alpha-1,3-fucosyltransferase 10